MMVDNTRTATQRAAILERLKRGPATGPELNDIAHRFGARIKELRDSGHQIHKAAIGGGQFRYSIGQRHFHCCWNDPEYWVRKKKGRTVKVVCRECGKLVGYESGKKQ